MCRRQAAPLQSPSWMRWVLRAGQRMFSHSKVMVAATIVPGSTFQAVLVLEATPNRLILRLLGSASLRLLLALRGGISVLARSTFALRMGPPIELLSCGTARVFLIQA